MEKGNKISKGIVAGCLVMVLALTVWIVNINDTYSTDATSASPSPEDNCPDGYHLSNGHCCSVGYEWDENNSRGPNCYYSESKNEQCYFCTGVPAYVWSIDVPSSGCTGGTWEPVSNSFADCKLTGTTPTPTSCGDGEHLSYGHCCPIGQEWTITGCRNDGCKSGWYLVPGPGGICCPIGTVWDSDNDKCVETDDGKQCYFCTGTPAYSWSLNEPAGGCTGGTWEPVSKSKSECKLTSTVPTTGGTTPTKGGTTPTKGGTKPSKGGTTPSKGGTTPSKGGTKPSKGGGAIPIIPSSIISPRVYKATFYPNGGTWADGTTGAKTIQYTGEMYFSDFELKIVKDGYNLKGWQSSDGSIFTVRIDGSNNNDTLTAIWVSSSSSGGGSTTNPGIGDDETCDFISKDSCEIAYSGFNCVKDKNNCYVKGSKKTVLSDDPISNPNTGNSLLYLSIIIGVITFGYTVYYTSKIRKKEDNQN